MLALGVLAQASGTVFVSAPAFLIPLLHGQRGLSLAQAGLLAAAPTVGMVLTLIVWGHLADRRGERWVISCGLGLTALTACGAVLSPGLLPLGAFFLLGGMAAASSNAASGRVVVGWFPPRRRGLAMGIRQMAQPLGVAVAAATVPPLAGSAGIASALLLPLVLLAATAVACSLWLVNPPRPSATQTPGQQRPGPAGHQNPYRRSRFLARIHAVSVLLVVPQFTLSTFGLVWLMTEVHYRAAAAGLVVGAAQIVGALGRILAGVWSDRVGSRVGPLRWVALAAVAVMVLLAVADLLQWQAAALILIVATSVSVADNGLAFTAVAEAAGPSWSGRALGVQNTGQFLAAAAVGPVVGALIGWSGYPLAFLLTAAAPLAALPLVPRSDPAEPRA